MAMETHRYLKWGARVTGFLLVLFLLIFWISGGIYEPQAGSWWMKGFLLLSMAGYGAAWFKPVTGGWTIMVGSLLAGGYLLLISGNTAVMVYVCSMLLVALAFLASVNRELI